MVWNLFIIYIVNFIILSWLLRIKFVSIIARKNAGLAPARGPKPKNFVAKHIKTGAHGLKKTILRKWLVVSRLGITQIHTIYYNFFTQKAHKKH